MHAAVVRYGRPKKVGDRQKQKLLKKKKTSHSLGVRIQMDSLGDSGRLSSVRGAFSPRPTVEGKYAAISVSIPLKSVLEKKFEFSVLAHFHLGVLAEISNVFI